MLEDFKVVTPLVKLASFTDNDAYIKLEGSNLFGSAKDRCAIYVLTKLLEQGTIGPDTEIVESSSGNMGVALAAVGARVGLKITIMIDESISKLNEFLITSFGARTVKITQADENGSYLKARLQTVRDYIAGRDDVYWFNQYGNPLVIEAYRETVGRELCRQLPDVEYVFVAISSGGTIAGISQALKEHDERIQVVAVDLEGSKIFDPCTKAVKHLTGIGSSVRSENVERAVFDDRIVIDEASSLQALRDLLGREQLFLGGSTGCVVAGARKYMEDHGLAGRKIAMVSHDRGDRYYSNLYSKYFG